MVEDLMVCCRCDFYNFNQVHQCEREGETCKWLLSLKEKAEKWDVVSSSHREYLGTGTYGAIEKLEAAKKLLDKIIDGVDFYTCTQILISTPVIEKLRIALEGEE